jgi:hypothetical protein
MEYEIIYEGECGAIMLMITAKNRSAAVEELKRRYPDDIGADGTITNENTDGSIDEFPLNW